MTVYKVQGPDGRVHRFEGPDGATPDEVMAFALQTAAGQRPDAPPAPAQPQEGLGRTVFDNLMQGATFGFSDEISDILGAAGASALDKDLTFKDAYQQARGLTKERQERQFEQHPVAAVGSQIVGGIGTSVAGATTKAGTAALNWASRGNTAARAGKAALLGAPSAGLYSVGTGVDGERTATLGRDMLLGAAFSGAVPVAGRALSRLNTRTIIPNADQIRQRAGEMYQAAERAGGVLKPKFTDQFVDAVERMKPQTDIGRIVGGDNAFSKVTERLGQIRGQPMTLRAAQELDELLGEAIDGFTEMGRVTKQGKKLLDIQTTLRGMIEDAGDDMVVGGRAGFDALKEARNLWSTSHRLNDIERIIQRADQYDQPATAIKTGFRTLYNNPNRMRGYSAAERAAIKKAAESGIVSDVLRTAGSRLVPIVAGAGGGGLGGAAAGAAASASARGLAAKMQVGRAEKAARAVAERSGLVRQEQRLRLPDNWRDLLRLPPKQAQEAMLALPAPEPEFSADVFGNVGRMSPEDVAAAQAARQRAAELGMTPDVVRAQEAGRMRKAAGERGGSDVGRFAAQHPDVPASVFENLSEENWQYLMKLPPDEARTALMRLMKAQKTKKK